MVTPLSLANLTTPATAAQWNDEELSLADTLGLRTTTWQPGAIERGIFATVANVQQESDVAASIIVQAGFLDFAATGSVTYTNANGVVVTQYVTPDPSIPAQNPTGALGWLDVLGDSVYNVQRILKTSAGGTLALLNTTVSTYGPFVAGTYHVAQPSATGSPGYSNTASLTIAPSAVVGGGGTTISAATNATPIALTFSGNHGRTTGDIIFVSGALGNTAANGAWVVTVTGSTTLTLNGSVGNGAYTGGGVGYLPTLAAFTADTAGTSSNANTANVVNQSVTSLIGVSVNNYAPWTGSDTEGNVAYAARCRLKLQALATAGPKGAYQYFALSAQTYATILGAGTLSQTITRVLVTSSATGTVTVTLANADGAPAGSDVTIVDAVLQAYAVPVSVTETTQAAANHSIAVALTVYIPSAYNTAANIAALTQGVYAYFRALPIGGVTLPGGTAPNTNVVPYESVIGSVYTAAAALGIPLSPGDVQGTIAGGTSNVQLLLSPTPEVAAPTVSITPVPV